MKKLTVSFLVLLLAAAHAFCQTSGKLEVGKKAPDWLFLDANKNAFTMNSWPKRVLQINYVDPDEENLNEAYNEAVDKAVKVDGRIDSTKFKGIGIVDCKSTWKPNYLIRIIAGNKAKKYKTVILFDYDATLQKLWGLPSDSYSVVILDRNRICRALFKGKVPGSDIEKTIQQIIALTKEP